MPRQSAPRDPNERPITDLIKHLLQDSISNFADHRIEEQRNINRINNEDSIAEIHTELKRAEGRFDGVIKTRKTMVNDKKNESVKRLRDFTKFKKDNTITREPHYPNKGNKWLMFGFLIFVFVIESGANSAFLAKGNELGLMGGWILAFGISLLNICLPFLFFGPLSRYLGHVNLWYRCLANFAMFFYVSFATLFNLGVAHYREASDDLIGETGAKVVERMQDGVFGLNDAESWLLFGLGLMFSLIALLEGRWWDDVYPGYGALDRIMRKTRDEYLTELQDVHDELDEIRDSSLDKVERFAKAGRSQPERLRIRVNSWRHKCTEFDAHVAQLQQAGQTLIDQYREANLEARPDGTVPAAHRTPWLLEIPEFDRSDLIGLSDNGLSEERLLRIEEERRSVTDRICECCRGAMDSLCATPDSRTNLTVLPMISGGDTELVAK